MKPKTIKKVLRDKIFDWLQSIDDPVVRAAAEKDVICTGGAIVSCLLNEKISDFDLYFATKETTKLVADYYVAEFMRLNPGYEPVPVVREEFIENIKEETEERVVIWCQSDGVASEGGTRYDDDPELNDVDLAEITGEDPKKGFLDDQPEKEAYRPVFMSENAITLADKVQLVIRFYGDPTEIHRNYDYLHACNWYKYKTHHLELKKDALACIINKELRYVGSLYPIASLFRMRKFMKRGWSIGAGEIFKISGQIHDIKDLWNFNTLREQLTGCDQQYFHQLVSAVKADQERNPDKVIDAGYVAELVDRIFNT